eukprot:GHVR01062784.1.p1 GENE.GHVR01062784.1~~GHVR01062784.1.p1  ORF type:complete len:101 (+),score=1.57 GHVR01062784.1:532-834(+)
MIINVGDKANPWVVKRHVVSGDYLDGRITKDGTFKAHKNPIYDGYVYLFGNRECITPNNLIPWKIIDGVKKNIRYSDIFYYKKGNFYHGSTYTYIVAFNL